MNLKEIYERVRSFVETEQTTKSDCLASLVEETGEIATAIAVENGKKQRKIKESSAEEGIDGLLCLMELWAINGVEWGWVEEYAKKKFDKWDDRMSKKFKDKKEDNGK